MHYSIDYNEIDSIVRDYSSLLPQYTVSINDTSDKTKVIDFLSGKKRCRLNIYLQNSGLVSYSVQGPDNLLEIGENCFEYIKQKGSLPDSLKKTFSIKKCKIEDFDYLIEELRDEKHLWKFSSLSVTAGNQHSRILIESQTGSKVYITLYNNGTFYMQGNITPWYVEVMTCALEFLNNGERELSIDLRNTTNSIPEEIEKHIAHYEHLQEGDDVLIALIQSSLTLLNSGIIVSDYACYTFGVLKALEGLVKIRLQKDMGPEVGTKGHSIGTYFVPNTNNIWHFAGNVNCYNTAGSVGLKRALEHGYTTYYARRNTLFHTNYQVESTTLLDYNEARDIVLETLSIINEICNNWI